MVPAQPAEVLLVEDSPFDAELALLAFDHLRLSDRVLVVQDGEEALEYLFAEGRYRDRVGKHRPRVVLLDLKMPRVDGFEVLHAIKSDPRTRNVPVVVLTSSAQDRDIARGYELGANSFIVKPVDFSAFAEAVRSVGTYWLHLNQAPGP